MKKFLIMCLLVLCCVYCVACGSSSSSSSSDWEKDANEAGYVKKNGKWYYTGD